MDERPKMKLSAGKEKADGSNFVEGSLGREIFGGREGRRACNGRLVP